MPKVNRSQRGPQSFEVAPRSIHASVDWITCTATVEGSGASMYAIGDGFLRENERVGEDLAPWQMKGYRGWSAGQTRVGSRPSGSILSISGTECSKNWRDALAASENCSRLDLAVDSYFNPVVTDLAVNLYKNSRHVAHSQGRPTSSRLILASDGGSTAYFGARVSERFGRVYDKGIEQKTHGRGEWWRWELELKGGLAQRVSHELSGLEDESCELLSIVADFFRKKTGYSLPADTPRVVRHESPQSPSSTQSLHWLSQQVRPTVQRLLSRGKLEEVLFALGIPQSAVAVGLTSAGRETDNASSERRAVPTHVSDDLPRADIRKRDHDAGAYGNVH